MFKILIVLIVGFFLFRSFPILIPVAVFGVFAYIVYRICLFLCFRWPKFTLDDSALNIFFGAPGSGKTTLAAYFAKRALQSGVPVFSNVPIKGCYKLTKDDIGRYLIENALVIFDEAGVDFNSRNFKNNFTIDQIKWYKYHRHEGCQVIIFSQGFDDMDKILRTLSTNLYVVRKSSPRVIMYRRIFKQPDIDEYTHTPIDYYDFARFSKRRILASRVWDMFDSYTRLGLPAKDWEVWGEDDAAI